MILLAFLSCFLVLFLFRQGPNSSFSIKENFYASVLFHCVIIELYYRLLSSRLEVVGARKNGRARGRHATGEGAPARMSSEGLRKSSPAPNLSLCSWRDSCAPGTSLAAKPPCEVNWLVYPHVYPASYPNLINWQPLSDLSKILTENDWPRTNKACRQKALYILSSV